MDEPTSTPIQIGDIVRMFARRKFLLFTPWLLAVGLGVAAAMLLPPVYTSTVTLLLERPTQVRGALGDLIDTWDPERQISLMRDQLQSSAFLRDVVTATGLVADPSVRAQALKGSDAAPGSTADQRVEGYLVDGLRKSIFIKRAKGGTTFDISVEDRRPDRARRFAESVASQFILQSKAKQIEAVSRTQEFVREQEAIYKRKLEDAEAKLDDFRRAQLGADLSRGSVDPANLARARTLLDQADLDVDEQRQRLASLRQQYAEVIKSFDPAQLSSNETSTMSAQVKGLERQLAMSALLGEAGPDAGAARAASARKMSELEIQFTQNASTAFPGATPDARDALVRIRLADLDLQARESRRAYLSSQVGDYQQHVVASPEMDQKFKLLQQDVDNARGLYNAFLQQSVSSQMTEAYNTARVSGSFSVLEPANLPYKPDKPNKVMLILLGLVLGGAVGVGSVFIVERHDTSMRNAEEVEVLLGLPVIGAIPRVEDLDRRRQRNKRKGATGEAGRDPGLLHRLKTESPLGLEFRRIFIKLSQSRTQQMPRTLLVTSSTRGEGKTTTSACLAITLAREIEERILLVDFDLRSPALHRALGIPSSSWGLAQMLAQRNFDERFVRSTVLPNLDFLGAGKSDRPASDLVDNDSVEWFLKEARARYAMVLIDTAPTLAVPDPLIVGRAVEGVLYVIKAGQTVRKAAEYGVKVQREAKENLVGVLLNDAGEILPHYYGYHDAYGYASEAIAGEP